LREINEIILHCSASDNPNHDNVETIREWHLENGWNDIGYHFVILQNGDIKEGRKISIVGAHCKGHNSKSVGICLTGYYQFTEDQFDALKRIVLDLCFIYNIPLDSVKGHNFYADKKCPVFNWKTEKVRWIQ